MWFGHSLRAPGRLGGLCWAAAAIAAIGCGDTTQPDEIAAVTVAPAAWLLDSVGATVAFEAEARDAGGTIATGVAVRWSSEDPAIASIDPSTGIAVAVGPGRVTITATAGTASGEGTLEVYLASHTPPFTAGETTFGRNSYVEYLAGDLPLVLSAPHGGYLQPDEIADRGYGVTDQDRNTQELIREIADEAFQLTGHYPHVVICNLHRIKLDANREVVEAAQGDPFAAHAWREYHAFIEEAEQTVTREYGRGMYFDLHGHGHDIQRLELGYLLSAAELALPDSLLNDPSLMLKSSIRALALQADTGFAGLVRGPSSLGALLATRGFPAVPSPTDPDPAGAPYFTGGYDTQRHGSRDGGTVSGIQVEANYTGVRDTESSRAAFAAAFVAAVRGYLGIHLGLQLQAAPAAAASGAR